MWSRAESAIFTLAIILAGLVLRSGWLALPGPIIKYGGDALWALMWFVGLGCVRPQVVTRHKALAALAVCWGVECSQLYHAPWIDAIRTTLPGRLVLGSTFNPPDFAAYLVGIWFGAWVEWRVAIRRTSTRRRPRAAGRLSAKLTQPPRSWQASLLGLVGIVLLTFCAPCAGIAFPPGEWYASLIKPSWNPPAWLFGPVWSFLYLSMAVAAWLVWRQVGCRRALGCYAVQLLLNAAWTPVFFGAQQPGWALVVIVLLWGGIVVTLLAFKRVSRLAGWLMWPYLGWVSFATVLNFTLWRMNAG